MTDNWDNGDGPSRPLPKPELNPLQNPVLADNLGRWAQVYFTSPPDRREQAVVELLRELGQDPPVQTAEALDTGPSDTGPARPTTVPQAAAQQVVCPACRGTNGPTQRFCGLCGAALYASAEDLPLPPYPPNADGFSSFQGRKDSAGPEVEWLRDRVFASTEEEQAPRGRKYVFAAVAVVLLFGSLAYLQWKAQTNRVSNATNAPPEIAAAQEPPAPAATESKPPDPAAPDPAPSEPAAQTAQTAPTPVKAPAQVANTDTPRPAPLDQASARTPVVPTQQARKISVAEPIAAKQAPLPSAAGDGDLQQAQRYLEGKGTARDPSEAARWLWKAVGKQNSSAVLLLSDLYARGDGVPQSCDQARLLLVAASKRGATEAAAKLRSLESHGCR